MSCLAGFDIEDKAFEEMDVASALSAVAIELKDLNAEEKGACIAESIAFNLMAGAKKCPWRTHFGPMTTGEAEGKPFYIPDIARAAKGTTNYWEERTSQSRNPIMVARYADLAWDLREAMGEGRKNPDMARLAIDAYLGAISVQDELHHRLSAAARAMELAILLGDEERKTAARQALLSLHRDAVDSKQRWWFVYDLLIDNKNAGLNAEETSMLVGDMEKLLDLFSDPAPDKFNPHDVESIAKRLIKFHCRTKGQGELKRFHEATAKAFERFGTMGDGLLGSAVLGTSVAAYKAAGMPADAERVRLLLEQKCGEAQEQMVPIESKIEITKEEMDAYLSQVVVEDPGQTLANIAMDHLSKRGALLDMIERLAEEAPLASMIGRSLMAENRIVAKVGSVENDGLGRLLQQAAQCFQLSGIWLHHAFTTAIERHSLTPEDFVGWANRAGLYADVRLVREGIKAWFERDFIKAVHILVPQVEHGLRQIVAKIGKPVTKADRNVPGVSTAKNMGDILFDKEITDVVGPDLTLHLLALYTDPRGWNVRNEIAHGLLSADEISQNLAQWVVHTLLVFGLWEEIYAACAEKG